MKRLISFLSLLIIVFVCFAQENPKQSKNQQSCSIAEQKACGPTNTKTAEAKVLTELRQQIESLKMEKGINGPVAQGKTDDESLEIMVREMRVIAEASNATFPALGHSKSQQVADLKKLIKKLRK